MRVLIVLVSLTAQSILLQDGCKSLAVKCFRVNFLLIGAPYSFEPHWNFCSKILKELYISFFHRVMKQGSRAVEATPAPSHSFRSVLGCRHGGSGGDIHDPQSLPQESAALGGNSSERWWVPVTPRPTASLHVHEQPFKTAAATAIHRQPVTGSNKRIGFVWIVLSFTVLDLEGYWVK